MSNPGCSLMSSVGVMKATWGKVCIQIVIVVTFREADDALVFASFREQFKGIERDEILTVPKVIVLPTDAELVQQVEDDRVIEAPFSDVVGRVTARRAAAKVQVVRIGWAEQRAEVVSADGEVLEEVVVVRQVRRGAVGGIEAVHLAVVPLIVNGGPGVRGVGGIQRREVCR